MEGSAQGKQPNGWRTNFPRNVKYHPPLAPAPYLLQTARHLSSLPRRCTRLKRREATKSSVRRWSFIFAFRRQHRRIADLGQLRDSHTLEVRTQRSIQVKPSTPLRDSLERCLSCPKEKPRSLPRSRSGYHPLGSPLPVDSTGCHGESAEKRSGEAVKTMAAGQRNEGW